MLWQTSNIIVNKISNDEIILKEDIEIYVYGFYELMLLILNIISITVLGFLFNKIWQVMVFTCAFAILRTYAGGYHAKTPLRCYLMTLTLIATVLSVMDVLINNFPILLFMFIGASAVILKFSPVEAENKPLDEIEERVYSNKTYFIYFMEVIVVITTMLFNLTEIACCFMLAIVLVGLLQVVCR